MERMLTVKEFAAANALAVTTVYEWIAQDRIRAVRLGRAVRIPEVEAERLQRDGLPLERTR